jgi:hypothetical protein
LLSKSEEKRKSEQDIQACDVSFLLRFNDIFVAHHFCMPYNRQATGLSTGLFKTCRQSSGLTVIGHAKVMSYEDIVEAQKKRDITVPATRRALQKPFRPRSSVSADDACTHCLDSGCLPPLLLEENRILFEQNNEKTCRQSSGLTVIGHAKVMDFVSPP